MSTTLDQAPILGSNRLTHLSLVGDRATVDWDTFGCFGSWFPELEQLYLFAVLGCERWVDDFAIGEPVQLTEPGSFVVGVLGNFEQSGEPVAYEPQGGAGAYRAIGANGAAACAAGALGETMEPPTVAYRTPLPEDIKFTRIQRLNSLTIEHFGHAGDKKLAKSQEKVHMAHFWTCLQLCKDSLKRLEIGAAEERFFETKRGNSS
jgi:hypothetical protein